MNDVPAELLYALIFAAFLLLQYLTTRSGVPPQPDLAPQDGPIVQTHPAENATPVPARWDNLTAVAAASFASTKQTARLEASTACAATARQRIRSASPLGDRQELRRAFVGMTLLGPCRAREPPDSR